MSRSLGGHGARPLGVESDSRANHEQDEERESDKLGELKWLLGLGWRHRMQRRDFFERLHDQNENVEIK